MKYILILLLMFAFYLTAKEIDVSKATQRLGNNYGYEWSYCNGCNRPESAHYDKDSKHIFISNIIGIPTKKDGLGTIQKLGKDGKMLNPKWVEGLNAPKGITSFGGLLYVTDIDRIVLIDIETGKIISKIDIPDATFLNDITASTDGTIYMSDTFGNKIFSISTTKNKRKINVFAKGEGLDNPNGLVVNKDKLIVAPLGNPGKLMGHLYSLDLKTKKRKNITKVPLGNLDGLLMIDESSYLVSDFVAGTIYKISKEGDVKLIFTGMNGAADIGFIPDIKVMIIPRMDDNMISAFDISKF